MRAMVFAAGIGSRLKEFTKNLPKCLVPLRDGTTMLDNVIVRLKAAGVKEIVINLHHLGEMIEEHVKKKNEFGLRIHFTREASLLGTGGGLKNAQEFFSGPDPIFVHNSDIFSEISLTGLYEAHLRFSGIATLACMERPTSRYLLFDKERKLIGWENPGTKVALDENAVQYRFGFSGIQMVSSKIFEYMKGFEGDFSIISAYLKAVEAAESVFAHDIGKDYWIDMGTPEKLKELNDHLTK